MIIKKSSVYEIRHYNDLMAYNMLSIHVYLRGPKRMYIYLVGCSGVAKTAVPAYHHYFMLNFF